MPVRLPIVVPTVADATLAPEARLSALDTVWFQLAGTVCNLACTHCFISCGPKEDRVPMMSAAAVRAALADAARLGAREYYFTGGEPMLHPEFWSLCEEVLAVGPLTVLTNGVLIDAAAARAARRLFERARYSFDLRVSLDGRTPEENDPLRGAGTFAQIVAGLRALGAEGISPAITVVEHAGPADGEARAAFLAFVRALGVPRPRVKFLPLLRIGREERRTHGYPADELDCLQQPLDPLAAEALMCTTSRLVAPDGVRSCPILLDAPAARLAATLAESLAPIRLQWAACRTCIVDGLSCNT